MRYLITSNRYEPFLTEWFTIENNWTEGMNMVVYDLVTYTYCSDGKKWLPITEDHL